MRIRAAVLEQTGGPLTVCELDLAPPGPGEVLVRLGASGVCHSDQNSIDGTAETRCPAVLGHEGAGVVEAVGEGVTRVSPGGHVALSWTPSCGTCGECRRDLPWLCSTAWPAMGTGGLMDGTTRLARDGEPVYHYSFLSTFAEACVVPERCCVPIAEDVPFDVAGLVGCAITTGLGSVWRTAGVRPGDRVAVIGCGGVGLSALMAAVAVHASPVVAVDAAPGKLEVARSFGATDGVLWAGDAESTADAVREVTSGGVDYAIEATGRPEAMLAAFLSTRARDHLDGRIGEGWSGDAPNGSHVNVVLARRGSPTAAAALGMLAHPSPGHTPVLVCVGAREQEYEPVWPPTLMMNKATASEDRHQTLTWGAAQLGIGQGVLDTVADGLLEATGDLLVLVAVWVDPRASDETAVRRANRQAVRKALGVCVEGRDPDAAARLVADRDTLTNPFYGGS